MVSHNAAIPFMRSAVDPRRASIPMHRILSIRLVLLLFPSPALAFADAPEVMAMIGLIMGVCFVAPFAATAFVLRWLRTRFWPSLAAVASAMLVVIWLLTDVDPGELHYALVMRSLVCLVLLLPCFWFGWMLADRVFRQRPPHRT
jgi:hypothetical protein